MVKQAKEIYVLTDSSKFDKVSLHHVCPNDAIDVLITDQTNPKLIGKVIIIVLIKLLL